MTDSWAYDLSDGTNTPRQLVNAQGQITYSARYTPWGDLMQSSGTGNFTYGYLGGLMDTSTGLLYVGSGQYYDPTTGRFLSRNAKTDQTNPYVPWGGNPTGALFTPLALLFMFYSRRKKRGTLDTIIILVVLGVVLGMSLSACQQPTPSSPAPGGGNPPTLPPSIGGPAGPTPTPNPGSTPQPRATPTQPPTSTCTPTTWESQYGIAIAHAAENLLADASSYYVWGANGHPDDEDYTNPPTPRKVPAAGDVWGWNGSINLKERTGGRMPIVCADVIALSYAAGGLDLRTFKSWYYNPGWTHDPTRNVPALGTLLRDHHQEHTWGDGNVPQVGDMAFWSNREHSAMVVEVDGQDASQIYMVQASYSKGVITKMSFADWGGYYFGHPYP